MGFTPTARSFFGSPIPDRWRMSGDESVPPDTMICFLDLKTRASGLPPQGLVGTVLTATARPFSMMTLSILVLQARYRLECTARVEWI